MCVCVYAKTRDLILLRSCYADAGETELASISTKVRKKTTLRRKYAKKQHYEESTQKNNITFDRRAPRLGAQHERWSHRTPLD